MYLLSVFSFTISMYLYFLFSKISNCSLKENFASFVRHIVQARRVSRTISLNVELGRILSWSCEPEISD